MFITRMRFPIARFARENAQRMTIRAILVAMFVGLPSTATAFQPDEARRQALMESARASAAAIDRRNADQAFQAGLRRASSGGGGSNSAPSSSSGASGSGSAGSRIGGGGGGASSGSQGPQSVVATRTIRIFVGETLAQSAARLTREAAAGNVESQYLLGRMLWAGYGATADPVEARRLLSLAAAKGHIEANASAGEMLVNGVGGPVSSVTGMSMLAVAADAGNADAQSLWGLRTMTAAFESGNNAAVPRAIMMLERAADAGKALAQSTLGTLVYFYGVGGLKADSAKALKYLRMGVEQGEPMSLYSLGNLMVDGDPWTGTDRVQGWAYITRAVQAGNGRAMWKLGLCKLNGVSGQANDVVEGSRLIRRSAETGDRNGQFVYANMLYTGQGVPESKPEAIRYARLAADANLGGAQLMMAKMNYFGDVGIPKNPAEAVRWGRLSAESGAPDGQLFWGTLLWEGTMLPRDRVAAVRWFQKAAAQGDKQAIENMADDEVKAVLRTMQR